jgi:transcriptional regulator with XRE-family HTH domain
MTTKEKIEYMVSHGIKIIDLAKRVNCNQTTLGRWLRGETNISSRLEKDLNQMIQDFIQEMEILKE